ncbi:MAG: hypothetical protein NTZ83_04685 [Candidatus Pacearchaeota archaeon]|nr:hypothetical protein [Candidatus Pacearchaeota archaeon]
MDKIEIINLDEEEDEDSEDDEEEEEGNYEDYKELIKKKTDRELMETIALKLESLELTVKKMQDDLVDTYNLLIESQAEDDED